MVTLADLKEITPDLIYPFYKKVFPYWPWQEVREEPYREWMSQSYRKIHTETFRVHINVWYKVKHFYNIHFHPFIWEKIEARTVFRHNLKGKGNMRKEYTPGYDRINVQILAYSEIPEEFERYDILDHDFINSGDFSSAEEYYQIYGIKNEYRYWITQDTFDKIMKDHEGRILPIPIPGESKIHPHEKDTYIVDDYCNGNDGTYHNIRAHRLKNVDHDKLSKILDEKYIEMINSKQPTIKITINYSEIDSDIEISTSSNTEKEVISSEEINKSVFPSMSNIASNVGANVLNPLAEMAGTSILEKSGELLSKAADYASQAQEYHSQYSGAMSALNSLGRAGGPLLEPRGELLEKAAAATSMSSTLTNAANKAGIIGKALPIVGPLMGIGVDMYRDHRVGNVENEVETLKKGLNDNSIKDQREKEMIVGAIDTLAKESKKLKEEITVAAASSREYSTRTD
jgi:hypothetical protein